MAGNVWEWTSSDWSDDYQPETIRTHERRVFRDGSWVNSSPSLVASAFRDGDVPWFRNNGLGLRCAR